ncbi:MAG: hypothetical protein H7308_10640 [Chthonomonadaceae bacterium]|nr:hypothetical protein [Chthonomonadaceae bacterium]
MSVFLILLITGLAGMTLMALPGLFHANGGVGHATGSHVSHIGDGGHDVAHMLGSAGAKLGGAKAGALRSGGKISGKIGGKAGGRTWSRFIPNPRVIFSLLTTLGAFGYGFEQIAKFSPIASLIAAIIPALLVERLALTPLWNWMLTFAGDACAPLESVTLSEARAITEFRNGRGMISVEHDGRLIQLRAELKDDQRNFPVKVGETLQIETVDEAHERVTVSLR